MLVLSCSKKCEASLSGAAISQITRLELLAHRNLTATDEIAIHKFLALITIISISDKVEAQTILLRRATRLKLPDAIVGGTALATKRKLLTLDVELAAEMHRFQTEFRRPRT